MGELFATRNVNFNDKGYLKLARRSTALIYNQANFATVTSLQSLDGNTYLAVTGSNLKSFSLTANTVTDLNGTGHVGGLFNDGITWQNRWYVSQATTFAYYDGTSWTTGLGSLGGSSIYHPLCVHEGLNQLAIGENNLVYLYDSSHSLVTTITLPANFQVRWIRYNANYLYIGTKNIYGGEAEIFVADGAPSTTNAAVSLYNSSSNIPGCQWAFCGIVYKGILVIMSSNGQLLKQNGTGWDELAHLPIYNNPSYSWYNGSGFSGGKVPQRGMAIKGERIYINVDGTLANADGKQYTNQPSGLWVYDPDIGLYHHAGIATDSYLGVDAASVNTSTNVISGTSPTITGTKIVITSTDCTGLASGRYYYLIYISSGNYKLASSYTNAINNIAVSLGTGTAVSISSSENQSFGEWLNTSYQPGAIALVNDLNSSLAGYYSSSASEIIFGAGIIPSYTSNSSIYTLQTLTMGENRGTFVTTKIFSESIKDTWQAFFIKFNKIYQGNDKVVVKYRIANKENYPLFSSTKLTWVNSTSFTSTFDFSQVAIGDEIEFTSGRGAGCSAHMVSASNSAGTWTVVIDEAILGVSASDSTWFFTVDNWQKQNTFTNPTVGNYGRVADQEQSKWVQYKIEIRGASEPYIEELQIINKPLMPSA